VKNINYAMIFMAAAVAGCAGRSGVGLVDVQRIVANWPEYQSYQNQLVGEERSIAGRRESTARKESDTTALEHKYATVTDRLSQQIRDAAAKIAAQNRMTLVLTREGIGYGGTDITNDVEKALNITEKASPTPGI
jgi:Skp family chaperone for outer membrane proteins